MARALHQHAVIAHDFAGIERVGQYLVNRRKGGDARNGLDLQTHVIFLLGQYLLLGSPAAKRRHREALLNGPACKIGQAPVISGGHLEKPPDNRGAFGINWLAVHVAWIEITDRRFIGADALLAQVSFGDTHLLARYARVVLGEHAVNVHVQRAGTGLIVLREREAKIHARLHQLAQNRVVAFVAARSIPAEYDDALEIALAQPLHETVELRPLDAILYCVAVAECKLDVLLEAGVPLRNDAVGGEPFEREWRDLQFLAEGKAHVLGFLVLDGVFLVVGIVGALAVVYQVAVAVFAALQLLL